MPPSVAQRNKQADRNLEMDFLTPNRKNSTVVFCNVYLNFCHCDYCLNCLRQMILQIHFAVILQHTDKNLFVRGLQYQGIILLTNLLQGNGFFFTAVANI